MPFECASTAKQKRFAAHASPNGMELYPRSSASRVRRRPVREGANARFGLIVLDCTVLTRAGDGLSVGIVYVPDGFVTIAGNWTFPGG